MLDKLKSIWNKYGFEIVLGCSVLIILILALLRIGKKGTYSTSYYYNPKNSWKKGLPRYSRVGNVPKQKDSSGELECRRVLQKIFKKPFSKARPNFLRNPVTGGNFNLEIDCFCSELKLGCEYNGAQHYKYIPYFHGNKATFRNQQYRDYMKRTKCRENGITLIEVPYTVKISDIEPYIVNELKKVGYIK